MARDTGVFALLIMRAVSFHCRRRDQIEFNSSQSGELFLVCSQMWGNEVKSRWCLTARSFLTCLRYNLTILVVTSILNFPSPLMTVAPTLDNT